MFKTSSDEATGVLDGLREAGLLQAEGDRVSLTDRGRALHDRLLAETQAVTERLWGDLPGDDLAVAGRVLSTVLARANAEFA